MKFTESGDKILDQPERRYKSGGWLIVGYISIGLLLAGLILRYTRSDGALYPIALGFILMVVRYLGLFFSRGRSITAWLYLVGHIALLSCIVIMYTGLYIHPVIFFVPACCYLTGLLIPEKPIQNGNSGTDDVSDSETE